MNRSFEIVAVAAAEKVVRDRPQYSGFDCTSGENSSGTQTGCFHRIGGLGVLSCSWLEFSKKKFSN